ncbi:MAG: hypothetical protein ABI205_12010, partial [Gemmatimonadaceae bacterium]
MKSKQNAAAVVLTLSLVAAAVALFETGRAHRVEANPALDLIEQSDSIPATDQRALEVVQAQIRLPTTAEERPLAEQALRVADREMDLAFASAVRRATLHPPRLTAEAKQIADKLRQAQSDLARAQGDVARLTATVAKATDEARPPLNDQLALAQARQQLAQDEADDARQDLMRAGGDPEGRVQVIIAQHDAASKSSDSTRVAVTTTAEESGLVHRASAWWTLRQKQSGLASAKRAADSTAAAFTRRHQSLESRARRTAPGDSSGRRSA